MTNARWNNRFAKRAAYNAVASDLRQFEDGTKIRIFASLVGRPGVKKARFRSNGRRSGSNR